MRSIFLLFVVCGFFHHAVGEHYIVGLKRSHVDEDSDSGIFRKRSMTEILDNDSILDIHKTWLFEITNGTNSHIKLDFNFGSFVGYSGDFTGEVISRIKEREDVQYVIKDMPIYVPHIGKDGYETLGTRDMIDGNNIVHGGLSCQDNAPWNLALLSEKGSRKYLLNETYKYCYPSAAGDGVDVYILDSGINVNHREFEGRAMLGVNVIKKRLISIGKNIDENHVRKRFFDYDRMCGKVYTIAMRMFNHFMYGTSGEEILGGDEDYAGHGTHCAGIVGGATFGIAKNVQLISVKVVEKEIGGYDSDIIKGLEWVYHRHDIYKRRGRKSVVNISLGSQYSAAVDFAIDASQKLGVHISVAAGNEHQNACEGSPSSSYGATTVGSLDINSCMSQFSNFGKCVDVYAPGADIMSSWIGDIFSITRRSGTSMSSPHVAGVMALYLSYKDYTPAQLKKIIIESSKNNGNCGIPGNVAKNCLSIVDLNQEVDDIRMKELEVSHSNTCISSREGYEVEENIIEMAV